MVEARQAEVPLVAITADRPVELQGANASQTIDQVKLFGDVPRATVELGAPDEHALRSMRAIARRAVLAARGPVAGPVHVNARFRKPLEPDADDGAHRGEEARPGPWTAGARRAPDKDAVAMLALALLEARSPCFVVGPMPCGPSARALREAAVAAAAATGACVLAESTSGLRADPSRGIFMLGTALACEVFHGALAPDLVVEMGAAVVTGAYPRLVSSASHRITVSPTTFSDPFGGAHASIDADPTSLLEEIARGAPAARRGGGWGAARARYERAVASLSESQDGALVELRVARALATKVGHGALVLGNSLVVRDFEVFGAAIAADALRVLHQRGAAGIDGLLAGAVGTRLAAPKEEPVVLAYGDVSALHDAGSFALLPALRGHGPLVVLVVDNGGGRIFEDLPIARALDDRAQFERLYLTPPPKGLASRLARAFELPVITVPEAAALDEALEAALRTDGPTVIEAVVDPEASRSARERALVRARAEVARDR